MRPWETIIKERLDQAGWELPAEDWERLQARYESVKRRRTLRKRALGALSVALAAGLALVFFLKRPDPVDLIPDSPGQPRLAQITVPETRIAETECPPEPQDPIPASHRPSILEATSGPPASLTASIPTLPAAPGDKTRNPDRSDPASSEPDSGKEESTPSVADAAPTTSAPSAPAAPERALSDRYWEEVSPAHSRAQRRISLSTSGTLAHLERNGTPMGQQVYADAGSRLGSTGEDILFSSSSTLQRIAAYTQARDQKVGEIHHRPLELGLTVGFPLSRRWTVVSGIEYAYYPSTFSYSVSGTKRQEAHYLGLPLRLDYYLVDRDRLHLYLGAGVLADRGILARRDGERIPTDRFGFSVLGAGGLQWDLNHVIGLYLEPRYSLFLSDPEGRLVTFRTESPACFSLAAGLRIHL